MTILELREKFITDSYSPVEMLADSLALIRDQDDEVHAYLEVFSDLEDQAVTAKAVFVKEGEHAPAL